MSDINELFQKDPLNLTKEDLRDIIMYYRDRRNQFNLGDTQAGNAKKIKKAAAPSGPKISNVDEILEGL